MSNEKTLDELAAHNLPVVSAIIELGTAAICRILGDEDTSNQLNSVTLKSGDVSEILAARINNKLS